MGVDLKFDQSHKFRADIFNRSSHIEILNMSYYIYQRIIFSTMSLPSTSSRFLTAPPTPTNTNEKKPRNGRAHN